MEVKEKIKRERSNVFLNPSYKSEREAEKQVLPDEVRASGSQNDLEV
jgi:hypothetical protein